MEQIIIDMVSKYPIGMSILLGMGVFRVVFKPMFAFFRVFVEATPGQGDNQLLDSFERGPIYKGMAFLADFLLSVKLPK